MAQQAHRRHQLDRARHRRSNSIVKVVFASLVGTAVEWYDFFLYGSAAALVFGKLFFPSSDPVTGDPAGVRHLRARLRRPAARRRHLRALRRPGRPQEDAGHRRC